MAMRLSGLMSGMDTESVIQQLVLAKRTKVDDVKKAQTKLQWKTDAWKTLNSKILKLYNGILGSTMRFEGSYMKKVTKVSNSSVVNVITSDSAMNSVQTLEVSQLAKPSYLTGGQVGTGDQRGKMDLDSNSRLQKIGGWNFAETGIINVTVGDKRTQINVNGATTIGELVQAFKDAGVNASFDEKNQRFYISAKDTGADSDFTITAGNLNGLYMLEDLGLSYVDSNVTGYYDKIVGMDQEKEVENRLQGRLDSRVKELTDRHAALQLERDVMTAELDSLKNDGLFEGAFNNVDMSDLNAVRNKIAELKATYEEDEGREEEINALDAWTKTVDSLAEVEDEISDIESKVIMAGDTVELSDEEQKFVKEKVEEEVAAEVDEAQKMLNTLNHAAETAGAHKEKGEDAKIKLNGVEYASSKNTFEINGLTLTVNSTTAEGEVVTLTTQDDTDGIYDMIKSFIKEYSELINEMDKLYNADSSKGYEPLTSEEKEAMSESEIEEWEKKIKDSVLRKDDTLGTLSNALKQLMLEGVNVNGKMMYLTNFGIETLSYFTAAENEKNAYHIDGDSDDPNTASNEDKLRAMIATDPQTVINFFVGLSRNMYSELTTRMARTDYSSAYTAYEDVKMKKEYDDYTSKIKELEKKLSDYEDKWYQKFAQMETALAKLQSSASAVTSLLGG